MFRVLLLQIIPINDECEISGKGLLFEGYEHIVFKDYVRPSPNFSNLSLQNQLANRHPLHSPSCILTSFLADLLRLVSPSRVKIDGMALFKLAIVALATTCAFEGLTQV